MLRPHAADLGVTVTASPNPVSVGDLLQYLVTVTNFGPSSASNVVAIDNLPANMSVVSVAPSQGTFSVNGSTVNLNFGSLLAEQDARARQRSPSGPSLFPPARNDVDTATVSANEADPIPGNNSASVTTTVNASADLSLALTGTPNPVLVGGNLTYTIVVTNDGPSEATGVVVTDVLPAFVNVLSITTDGTFSNNNGVVTAGPLPLLPAARPTVTIVDPDHDAAFDPARRSRTMQEAPASRR